MHYCQNLVGFSPFFHPPKLNSLSPFPPAPLGTLQEYSSSLPWPTHNHVKNKARENNPKTTETIPLWLVWYTHTYVYEKYTVNLWAIHMCMLSTNSFSFPLRRLCSSVRFTLFLAICKSRIWYYTYPVFGGKEKINKNPKEMEGWWRRERIEGIWSHKSSLIPQSRTSDDFHSYVIKSNGNLRYKYKPSLIFLYGDWFESTKLNFHGVCM